MIACDFIISATGVLPMTDFLSNEDINKHSNGAILVNESMQSSIADIYAAGVCSCYLGSHRELNESDSDQHCFGMWFQMKLWSQVCY